MKATRVFAFIAAVLITLAVMLVVTDQRIVAPATAHNDATGANVAASLHSPGF
jgi:hypothetical protein